MPLPDYIEVAQGTAIVWAQPGVSGANTLSFNNLANGAAQMGAGVDLGANFADEYLVYLAIETGTAPTAGATVDVHLVSSHDGVTWPAKVTGSDAVYTLGTADANLRQAGLPAVVLVATADANAVLRQSPVIWRPRGRYVAPIVVNRMGQAIRNQSPASNNASRLILVPRRVVVNE